MAGAGCWHFEALWVVVLAGLVYGIDMSGELVFQKTVFRAGRDWKLAGLTVIASAKYLCCA